MQLADPHLVEQIYASARVFLPARSRPTFTVDAGESWLADAQALLSFDGAEQRVIVDPLFAEELTKAEDGSRSPAEAAERLEAVGLIALRIATHPTSDSQVTCDGDLLMTSRRDEISGAGAIEGHRHHWDTLLMIGWEAALVRSRLAELSRKTGLLCDGEIIRSSDLGAGAPRSTLSWLTGTVLSQVFSHPEVPSRSLPLWPLVDIADDVANEALLAMRRNIGEAGLVQMLISGLAKTTRRDSVAIASILSTLTSQAADGAGREQISCELGVLLSRLRAKPVQFH